LVIRSKSAFVQVEFCSIGTFPIQEAQLSQRDHAMFRVFKYFAKNRPPINGQYSNQRIAV